MVNSEVIYMNIDSVRKLCDAFQEASQDPNLGSKKLAFLIWKLKTLTKEFEKEFNLRGNVQALKDLSDYGPDIICPEIVSWYTNLYTNLNSCGAKTC